MLRIFKSILRNSAKVVGLDIVRYRESPSSTMLGLRALNIKTVIDVGANVGQFARIALRVFPKSKIYCFEPLGTPYNQLALWANKQNGRVRCFNIALGDRAGQMTMYEHQEHTPSSSLLQATDHCHDLYPQTSKERISTIEINTLDEIIVRETNNLEKNILLKLDVQGFEDRVLRGAESTLNMCSACIIEINLDNLYKDQADFHDIFTMVHRAGYSYAGNLEQVYDKDGRVVYFDAVFIKS